MFTFQKIVMMYKPKMHLKEVSNYFSIEPILPFIHLTAPCEKANSEECCENAVNSEESTQGMQFFNYGNV